MTEGLYTMFLGDEVVLGDFGKLPSAVVCVGDEAVRYVPERTCELERTIHWDGACADYWEHELSCGHTAETLDNEPPSYCMDCGAKVVEQ